jgi:uncharacterized protein YndB with AHSA1/START domain
MAFGEAVRVHVPGMVARMASPSEGFTLTMSREIPAAREIVFHALVDPGQIAEWFGPEGYIVSSVDFTAREGARYRIELQPPEGERFHISGEVNRADRPSLLEFSFIYEEPSPEDTETRVRLSLAQAGTATRLHLVQTGFKTEDRRSLHDRGWSDSLDKLERLIAKKS